MTYDYPLEAEQTQIPVFVKPGHFMKTLQYFTIFFILAINGCANNSQAPINKVEGSNFTLDISELRLLTDGSCNKEIDLNSLNSISHYDSIIHNYYLNQDNSKNSICICFNFKSGTNFNSKRLSIQLVPLSYGTIATNIPKQSFLWVAIADSTSIDNIIGNEFYFGGHKPTDSLNNYVKRLFLNKPDTSRYRHKFINLLFPNDSLHLADTYLTQLVIGYIKAQREICQLQFGKALKDATTQDIQELKRTNSFVFKIKRNLR